MTRKLLKAMILSKILLLLLVVVVVMVNKTIIKVPHTDYHSTH